MSGAESSESDGTEGLKGKLREELRKYLVVSGYLYICFAALQLYKTALLQDVGVHYLPLGVAVVKALIVGKFLLIGDAIQARLQRRPGYLLGRIARRLFWLLLVLILLTIAEELIVGWVHGHAIAEMQAEFRARSMLEGLAEVLLMGLILLPLVAAAEVSRALGPGVLRSRFVRSADGARRATDQGRTQDQGST